MNQAVTIDYDLLKQKMKPILSRMRVMVVDDMPMNIDSYRLILLDLGIQRGNIFSATNGLNAFTSMNAAKPHLVLADWNMPVMDGLGFAKRVRENSRFTDLVILMITAESEADLELARAYVNAFLRKPVKNGVIERMILSVVAKKLAEPGHPIAQLRG
jgi:CheY-like chemotaxis protein